MDKVVEGEWNNAFEFKMAKPEDFQNVLGLLRESFYRDEFMSKLLKIPTEAMDELDRYVIKILEKNMSFIVLDKNTKKVIGARITSLNTLEEKLEEKTKSSGTLKSQTSISTEFKIKESQLIIHFLEKLASAVDIFDKFEVNKFAHLMIIAVDKDYRQNGLATEMYKRALAQLKYMNLAIAVCIFTNDYARRAATKLGFQEVARLQFAEHFAEYNCPAEEFASMHIIHLNK